MYFSHAKVGQRVIVTSECGVYGMTGVVEKVKAPAVYVRFEENDYPVRLAAKSLRLVEEPKHSLDLSNKRVGIFFSRESEKEEIEGEGISYFDDGGCLVVFGNTKEECLEKLDDQIEICNCIHEDFNYLLFDGIVYNIESTFKMVITNE